MGEPRTGNVVWIFLVFFLQDMCNDWWQGNKYSADNLDEADLESCVMMREGYPNLLDQ